MGWVEENPKAPAAAEKTHLNSNLPLPKPVTSFKKFLLSMKNFTLSILASLSLFSTTFAATPTNPDQSLAKLLKGNARYVSGQSTKPRQSESRRLELASDQKPFAVVVTCADSRTSPEIIFDQGIGDVFVTRLAGGVVDDAALGSIEYAVRVLGSKIILVTGHEDCGAVKAAMQGGSFPGHFSAFIKLINPGIASVKNSKNPTTSAAVDANARYIASNLPKRSAILASHIKDGSLKILPAHYNFVTGRVTVLK